MVAIAVKWPESSINNIIELLKNEDDITKDIVLQRLVSEYNLSYDVLKDQISGEEVIEIPTFIKAEKKVKTSRYVKSVEHILYYMMNSNEYIDIYKKRLGFFRDEVYRNIANEIIYYAEHNKISLADFLVYAESSPLKREIFHIIEEVNDDLLDAKVFEDYIYNVKELMWEEEKKELKRKQKATLDIAMKEKIGKQIVEITKSIQELKVERSGLK